MKDVINEKARSMSEYQPKVDETAIVRKMTLRILPYLFVLYVLAFLDRANLGNAHTSMLRDIHLTEEEYATGVSVFFIGYILFEIPSNLLLKLTTAPRWFAFIMVTWGIISSCMMFVNNFTVLVIVRGFCWELQSLDFCRELCIIYHCGLRRMKERLEWHCFYRL